ncbi:hypothetical protein V500_00849 [Pseudogymnoascus sp. VKM F-4518 (FW-2643)]|nr:hypothetical protein V500_00849 [Pseudogymnoascus sp. VKM F-4518 (FW-2643)]
MWRIPFVSRLNLSEYVALVVSFVLVGLEALIRVLTLALPTSIITLCYRASKRLFHYSTSTAAKKSVSRQSSRSSAIRDASDFVDLCALSGYLAEEHVVQTSDGYLLGLHRLGWKRGEEDVKVNSSKGGIKKPVVYLHHGLLMNSEVWVCLTDEERCLPFHLVEKGYDVWFGNNRGNKYSKKSIHHPPTATAFWDFSMDEFAFHDIPDSIDYILSTTYQPSLSYIGFSQGTAQAFATLSIHPKLNDRVNVFIALAPAMSPAGLRNGVVDSLMKASPEVLFLLFGRRSILSSTTMWESIMYPPIFVRAIDTSLAFLFGWYGKNISMAQKLAAYPHLYSFTSTKSVVHWFQIIRTASFQLYDDDVQPPLRLGSVSKYTKVARFPTRNIKTPVVLVYGGSDSLVDIDVMLKQLPAHTVATEIPHFEHLDLLWARDVDTLVFPHVIDALESFSEPGHTEEHFAKYRAARHASLGPGARRPHNPTESTSKSLGSSYADVADVTPDVDEENLVLDGPRRNTDGARPSLANRRKIRGRPGSEGTEYDSTSSSEIAHVTTARATEYENPTDTDTRDTTNPTKLRVFYRAHSLSPVIDPHLDVVATIMAAAAITQTGARFPGIAALFEKSSISSSDSVDASRKKDAVANMFLSSAATRSPPGDLTKGLVEKHLGGSSKTLRLQDFKLLRILGTGTFARVWLVKLSHPMQGAEDRVFALKVLRKTEVIKLKQVDHVNHERAILADVAGYPFITTLITTFTDSECLYMLLDYCPGGEIFSYLRRQRRFPEHASQFYLAEIVLILEFLHEREGVAYRDLKPENILLDAAGHVKLVDFGFAKRVRDRETYTLCGTPEYLAPEVIQSQGHSTAVDWWALGILMYEFITGYPPFWHQNPMEIYKQIIHKRITFPPHDPPISSDAQDLILALCTVDRSHRLGNLSGGAADVKCHPFFASVNWDDVYARRHNGPIIPKLSGASDDSCFERYSEDEGQVDIYTQEAREKWDSAFEGF